MPPIMMVAMLIMMIMIREGEEVDITCTDGRYISSLIIVIEYQNNDDNSDEMIMTMMIREGEEVDITCTVHASPPASVTWIKGNAKLSSSGRCVKFLKIQI